MALLVTGAMGHVGLAIVRQAAAAGETVVAQYRTTFVEAEARGITGNVSWVSCDLSDEDTIETLCRQHPIHGCIHSAAISNEKYARPQPLSTVHSNIGATAHLLDLARRFDWHRFLFVSTGSVFQNATDTSKPILEDAQPSVTNVYSTTKYCGELLVRMYRSQFELSAAVVRISWVYGPPLVTDDPPRGPMPGLLRAAAGRQADPGCRAAPTSRRASPMWTTWRQGCSRHGTRRSFVTMSITWAPGMNYTARQVADAVRAAVPGAALELGPGTEPWTMHTRMRGSARRRSTCVRMSASPCRHSLERAFAPMPTGCARVRRC